MKTRKFDYDKVITDFKNGKTTNELSLKYNTKIFNIQRVIRDYGNIKTQFNEQEKSIIQTSYLNGITPLLISQKYNFKISRVYKYLKSINILKNKKQANKRIFCNENYFDIIDTEDKAYFLGLLYADGCVHKNILSISLQEKDKEILEKFKNFINYTGNLNLVKKRNENQQNQFQIQIISDKLTNSLKNLGCIPNKSLILQFPTEKQVPSHLIHHFIRGYFDGDGSIFNNGNSKVITIIGSRFFIKDLKVIFNNLLKTNKIEKIIKNNLLISFYKKSEIEKIYTYFYSNSNIYLQRKYEKFKYNRTI